MPVLFYGFRTSDCGLLWGVGGGSRLYRTVGFKVFVALMEAVLDCKGSMEVVVGLMVVLCGG